MPPENQLERAIQRAAALEATLTFLRDKCATAQAKKNGLDAYEVAGFLRVATSCLDEAPKLFDAKN
jgi:hypothetical protein